MNHYTLVPLHPPPFAECRLVFVCYVVSDVLVVVVLSVWLLACLLVVVGLCLACLFSCLCVVLAEEDLGHQGAAGHGVRGDVHHAP